MLDFGRGGALGGGLEVGDYRSSFAVQHQVQDAQERNPQVFAGFGIDQGRFERGFDRQWLPFLRRDLLDVGGDDLDRFLPKLISLVRRAGLELLFGEKCRPSGVEMVHYRLGGERLSELPIPVPELQPGMDRLAEEQIRRGRGPDFVQVPEPKL